MKKSLAFAFVLLLTTALSAFVAAQATNDDYDRRQGFPSESRIESSQGQPDTPDVISHKYVSKGTRMKCIQVEHHPKQEDDGAACVARLRAYANYTLKFGEVMRAPNDSELYVECAGDKPTRCTLECGRKQGLRLTGENIQVMLIEERGSIDSAYLLGHALDNF